MTVASNALRFFAPAGRDDAVGEIAPETEVAADIARRAVLVSPVFIVVAAIMAGTDGALSAGIGIALVLANFALAAASLAWAARINLAILMTVALFGYLLRLGVLFGAVLILRELDWVHLASLGLTIVVMHLGLLIWELKYVSLSLAHPGLAPSPTGRVPAEKEPRK